MYNGNCRYRFSKRKSHPDIEQGLEITFDADSLKFFTQWKMMGERDYVLGLEPGNCTPDGRNVLRENNTLKFLQLDQSATTTIKFTFINEGKTFEEAF